MIAKNKKGKSFGGCVRYVMNEGCEVLVAEGVLADDPASITRDFAIQRSGRPEIKQPVGHIAVSFSPEDSPRMTSDFMLTLAHEYMTEMGIRNTQYVVVRHHNTDHDHFHIVYNRIDNDLKLISVNNDYRRNVAVCKKIKDRHHLTYGTGKEKINRPRLTGTDRVKYQIHDEIAANISKCATYSDLEKRLRQAGITIQYKYRSGADGSPENIQGVSFAKGDYSFKGSDIDRKFSHTNLSKTLKQNLDDWFKTHMEPEMTSVKRKTEWATTPVVPSPELPKPQTPKLTVPQVSEPSKQQDRQQYVPKEPSKSSVPEASKQPEPTVETIPTHTERPTVPSRPEQPSTSSEQRRRVIHGVEITAEQWETLQSGGHIFVENMEHPTVGKLSSYVFLDDERKRVFYSYDDPDKFVKYGKYEMRLRDKMLVERGNLTRAKVKYYGGGFARPYLWKENPADTDYKESWSDPRIPKEQLEQDRQASENRFRRPPAVNRTPPAVNRTIPPSRTTPQSVPFRRQIRPRKARK